MRILVCGDRNWSNYQVIYDAIKQFNPTVIIEGGAKGADSLGNLAAGELGIRVFTFPADWKTYGRAAGPIRNRQMLKQGQPELILAFHNDLSQSKGTKDMVSISRKAGIRTIVINEHGIRSEESTLF